MSDIRTSDGMFFSRAEDSVIESEGDWHRLLFAPPFPFVFNPLSLTTSSVSCLSYRKEVGRVDFDTRAQRRGAAGGTLGKSEIRTRSTPNTPFRCSDTARIRSTMRTGEFRTPHYM